MSLLEDAPVTGAKNDVRPMTGDEYLESLRDDREVYIYGERVKDVTTHPAFRNSARSVARLYDALHDPEESKVLTVPTDTGNGGFTHPFFRTANVGRGPGRGQGRDRRLAAQGLRLDGPLAGLQGRVPRHARRQQRVLRRVRRQRPRLLQAHRRSA